MNEGVAGTMVNSTVTFRTKAFVVEVDNASGTLSLVDVATNRRWEADPWYNTAGTLMLEGPHGQREFLLSKTREIIIQKQGESTISIVFSRLISESGDEIDGVVKTRISQAFEDEGSVRVEVLSVNLPADWVMVELEYPSRFGALKTDVDAGYMVAPYLQGSMVPSTVRNWKEIPKLNPWAWDDGPWGDRGGMDARISGWTSCSLPIYGIVDGKSAFMGLVETEVDASFRFVLNSNYQHVYNRKGEASPHRRLAVTSPVWLSEREQLGYARSVLFVSLPGGDYVSMTDRYRRHAKDKGLLVTLREKIQRTPELEKAIGALWINMEAGYPYYIDHPPYRFTWKDAKALVDDLRDKIGLERALLTLWIGYQNLPPDNYPFHPAQGPLEDLQHLVKYANNKNILVNFYHGWPTCLDDAPNSDIARARRGRKSEMSQRWGRMCPEFYPLYAKKIFPPFSRTAAFAANIPIN